MPELPEVETFRRILEGKLVDREVACYELFYPRLLLTEPSSLDRIVGKRFTKIGRKGKHLIFFLTGGVVMVAHLRMEGKYFVKDEQAPREKADELFIHLRGGKKLVYNDVRKFGVLGVYDEANYLTDSPLAKVAKSPLEMDEGELFLALHKLKKPIKEGLLDIFVDAGCAVNTPSCGPCMGGHMGVMAAGEKCVSTTNRNFVGRMGHVDSLIYLASPEVAAASAIAGYIANPEKVGEAK